MAQSVCLDCAAATAALTATAATAAAAASASINVAALFDLPLILKLPRLNGWK